jgi:ComF family protein
MLKNLLNVLFPQICMACRDVLLKNESDVCTRCRHDLPHVENSFLERKFFGIVPIEKCFSLYMFSKNEKVQNLIHELKYRNRQEVGTFFGEQFSFRYPNLNNETKISHIIKVPLHKRRKSERGYNQLDVFAKHISDFYNLPIEEELLLRQKYTTTQTKKNKELRLQNMKDAFMLNDKQLVEPHFLLVDDVATSGATLELCAKKLLEIPNAKVSILAIAVAE